MTVMLAAVLLALAAVQPAWAAADSSRVDLAGMWDFRFDPDSRGEEQGWHKSADSRGWVKIQVPGSYDQSRFNNLLYQGRAWYRTTFQAPPANANGRVFLKFEGVTIRSKVWVNGQLIGKHLFPYTRFEMDISDAVRRDSPNLLAVLVDNAILERAIPDKGWRGWWNYGGINRGVSVESRPPVYTEDVAVTTRLAGAAAGSGAWELRLQLRTRNHSAAVDGSIEARVEDSRGRALWSAVERRSFASGVTETLMTTTLKQAAAWSPESPALHVLKLRTVTPSQTHEKTMRFGLRQIEAKGNQILLNGKPVFLKGVNRHEMFPGEGMTVSREQTRKDLEDIKALGCNMVRTTHYTQDTSFYELADEMGLLVWTEIPAWQTRAETLEDENVWKQYGEPQLREMVEGYRGYTSIVIWSVGNEFPSEKEPVAKYVERGCALVRKLDPSRLVTFASDKHDRDISFAPVDFLAINEYYGWYYGKLDDLGPVLDKLHAKWPDKPIVVAEFGSEAIPGWRNPSPGDSGTSDYSEDYQVKLLTSHLEQIFAPSRRGFMAGAIIWLYNDFPNPSSFGRLHPPVISFTNAKGLVTQDRQRKRSWYEVQKAFRAARE